MSDGIQENDSANFGKNINHISLLTQSQKQLE